LKESGKDFLAGVKKETQGIFGGFVKNIKDLFSF
ncbi:hypothetical protein NPIL_674331, partial [Nephila pilipes]